MSSRHSGSKMVVVLGVVAAAAVAALIYLTVTRPTGPLIFVGASMQKPMAACLTAYEKKTGVHIQVSYEDSGDVLAHVKKSGAGDLAILHEPFIAQMNHDGFATRTETLAYMTPVIAIKKTDPPNQKNILGLKDLARPDVRVGLTIAKETTSGRLVQAALKNAGIQDEVMGRKPYQNKSSGDLVGKLTLAEPPVDAVTVWNAVAGGQKDKIDIVRIEPQFMPKMFEEDGLAYIDGRVPVGLVVLKTSRYPEQIKAFIDFMLSPEGQAIWQASGFDVGAPTTAPQTQP